jgi:hypothetical protein
MRIRANTKSTTTTTNKRRNKRKSTTIMDSNNSVIAEEQRALLKSTDSQDAIDTSSDTDSVFQTNASPNDGITIMNTTATTTTITTSMNETTTAVEEYVFRGDYHRFVYFVPDGFESFWQRFDDFFIRVCQRFQNKLIKLFCKFITALTSIELGITAPLVLFLLGLDYLATIALYQVLSVTIVSQIPKRFVFRKRPHVAGRAIRMSKNHTSSFPSRAVTCAILYAAYTCFAIRYAVRHDPTATFSFWFWIWPVVFIAFIVTSFARIHLGVHYPSDCLFAAVQVRKVDYQ